MLRDVRSRNNIMPLAGSAYYCMGNESITGKAHSKQVMINVGLGVFAHMFTD